MDEGGKETMGHAISVFGLGYVGCVTAACFAHKGFSVTGIDVNSAKLAMLDSGRSPIIEPGLEDLIAEGRRTCRLHASADVAQAIQDSDISFICVGTPSLPSGKQDLSHIQQVCSEIGRQLAEKDTYHVVVLRSTMLPGSTVSLAIPLLEQASKKRAGVDFGICYHPEFTREGTAVSDFLRPPYTILGSDELRALRCLREVYDWISSPIVETSIPVAEMVKYVSNTYHAVKVAFANEIGTLCRHLRVDTKAVTRIFLSDNILNISKAYLSPGFAFGGSCLPKDLRGLTYRARELDIVLPLLQGVLPSNYEHIERAAELVMSTKKKKLALLGLSFKAGTDDLRESPHVQLAKKLLGEGFQISVWDPQVSVSRLVGANRQYIEETLPHIGRLLSDDLQEVLGSAEVILIGTKCVDQESLASQLRPDQIVIDLVNLEKPKNLETFKQYWGLCW
ncbi:MAG: nucleotide sugar dehydrogenase [Candidatus Acidiferrales bacterium]